MKVVIFVKSVIMKMEKNYILIIHIEFKFNGKNDVYKFDKMLKCYYVNGLLNGE